MKTLILSVLFLLLLLSGNSCKKEEEGPEVNCDQMKVGLVKKDNIILNAEISKLVEDLTPVSTENDQTGHNKNLEIFVARINRCNALDAEIVCYACIETYPAQSEVAINIDSSGVQIRRVVDILTPENNILKFANCHD